MSFIIIIYLLFTITADRCLYCVKLFAKRKEIMKKRRNTKRVFDKLPDFSLIRPGNAVNVYLRAVYTHWGGPKIMVKQNFYNLYRAPAILFYLLKNNYRNFYKFFDIVFGATTLWRLDLFECIEGK